MKRKRRRTADGARPTEIFVRGFVATALLSAIQDRTGGSGPTDWRRVLRHGLQGGAALTAGTLSAQAMARRDYGSGATAVLAGAAAVMAVETILNPPSFLQESSLGQEEA